MIMEKEVLEEMDVLRVLEVRIEKKKEKLNLELNEDINESKKN